MEKLSKMLGQLGVHVPVNVSMIGVFRKLIRVELLMRKTTDHAILSMPRTRDEKAAETCECLSLACELAFEWGRPPFFLYCILTLTLQSLKHGLPYPLAWGVYGKESRQWK